MMVLAPSMLANKEMQQEAAWTRRDAPMAPDNRMSPERLIWCRLGQQQQTAGAWQ